MKSRSLIAGVLALAGLLACATAVVAQPVYVPPSVERAAGVYVPIIPGALTFPDPVTGKATVVSSTNGLPVNCILGCGGGGGGGGGDASAANQVITNTRLGDISAPAAGSVNQRLGLINTTLGSPFQAGGSIGNTAFGISGTLPAFASTPTVNLGTIGLAATAAKQDAMTTALGSPFQAGGSIGNTVFGATQSGTWNVTNVSGTVSLPTGASTSALQSTGNSSLSSIDTKLSSQATAANQTTGNSTLSSILAKLLAAPATEAKQDTGNTALTALVAALAPTPASAVTGTFVATGNGNTFTPAAGKAFNLALWATGGTNPGSALNATVYLARSTDGGTVYLPMTAAGTGIFSFTTLANESLYESQSGVIYRLICSSYASGTVNYRFSQ